jgi:hypothetical protein
MEKEIIEKVITLKKDIEAVQEDIDRVDARINILRVSKEGCSKNSSAAMESLKNVLCHRYENLAIGDFNSYEKAEKLKQDIISHLLSFTLRELEHFQSELCLHKKELEHELIVL